MYPNVLIFENDLFFLSRLTQTLQSFSINTIIRSRVGNVEDYFNLRAKIHCVICNLDLEDFEGLTLYAILKKIDKFRDTPFIFIADNESLYSLVKNISLDNATILSKNQGVEHIVVELLNQIQFPEPAELKPKNYVTSIEGELELFPVTKLLEFAKDVFFSGVLIITAADKTGTILFDRGKVQDIYYNGKLHHDALEELNALKKGRFRFEMKIWNLQDLSKFLGSTDSGYIGVTIDDILMDLLNSVYQLGVQKGANDHIIRIINQKMNDFSEHFPHLKNILHFQPEKDEPFVFTRELQENEWDMIVELLNELLHELSNHMPGDFLNSFRQKIDELKPYLEKFDLLEKLEVKRIPSVAI